MRVKFAAALAAADPSERFDPFADAGPGSANAALYPDLTRIRRSLGTSDDEASARIARRVEPGLGEARSRRDMGIERNTNESRQEIDPGASFGPPIDLDSQLTSLRANAKPWTSRCFACATWRRPPS